MKLSFAMNVIRTERDFIERGNKVAPGITDPKSKMLFEKNLSELEIESCKGESTSIISGR